MEAEASSSDGSIIATAAELGPETVPYELNTKVLCSHTDNLYYEAKIIAVEKQPDGDYMYTVHYQGWSKRYDENILHSRTASRFRAFTQENITNAKAVIVNENSTKSFLDVKAARKSSVMIELQLAKARVAESLKKKKIQKTDHRRGRRVLQLSESSYLSRGTQSGNKDILRRAKLMDGSPNISRDSSCENLSSSPSTSEISKIPEKLRILLDNDRHLIEKELKLPRLPGRSSVSKILKEYVSHVRKLDALCAEVNTRKGRVRYWKSVVGAVDECADNMKSYFDLVIFSDILYPKEKLRHKDLTEGPAKVIRALNLTDLLDEPTGELRASECYGFIYLLRLLVQFQEMINYMPCDNDTAEILTVFTKSFICYLGSNSEKFFNPEEDYVPITKEYMQRLQRDGKI